MSDPSTALAFPWTSEFQAEARRRIEAGEPAPPSKTYAAGCHCGAVALDVTLSPPLEQGHVVVTCNCSICTRNGYLVVYPTRANVQWRGDDRAQHCNSYHFGSGKIEHLFCRHCGSSMVIDFGDVMKPVFDGYGINIRAINGVDLTNIVTAKNDGRHNLPGGDLSGTSFQGKK